jgi:cell wall-associated NlpC family hydrolase
MGDTVGSCEFKEGDLIFTSSKHDYFMDNPRDGVGHVGIYIGEETVAHVTNRVEKIRRLDNLNLFLTPETFRGARRILPESGTILTIKVPDYSMVETSDDVRWQISE